MQYRWIGLAVDYPNHGDRAGGCHVEVIGEFPRSMHEIEFALDAEGIGADIPAEHGAIVPRTVPARDRALSSRCESPILHRSCLAASRSNRTLWPLRHLL